MLQEQKGLVCFLKQQVLWLFKWYIILSSPFSFSTKPLEEYLKIAEYFVLSVTTVKTNSDFSEQSILLSNSDMLQCVALLVFLFVYLSIYLTFISWLM